MARFKFTAEHVRQLREDYPSLGSVAMAERLGCSPATVRNKASTLGIRSDVWHTLAGRHRSSRNQTVRLDFFDSWTPESAYVLGYIWADGCVRTERGKPAGVEFICTEDDAQILRDVATVLGCPNKLREHPARTWTQKHGAYAGRAYQSKAAVRLAIHSTALASKLIADHGIPPRKSSCDPPFPSNIPDEYLSHFARGNFDGDGSITLRPRTRRAIIYWLGTPSFVTPLAERIAALAGVARPILCKQGRTLLRASWGAKPDALGIRAWLYRDSTIHLARKFQKFEAASELLAGVKDYKRRKGRLLTSAEEPVCTTQNCPHNAEQCP
jgi:hypothetical protein